MREIQDGSYSPPMAIWTGYLAGAGRQSKSEEHTIPPKDAQQRSRPVLPHYSHTKSTQIISSPGAQKPAPSLEAILPKSELNSRPSHLNIV